MVLAEKREIVELFSYIRVIASEDALPDLQGALAKRLRLPIFPAFTVQNGQIV